jgi:hypothetical protein
MMDGTNLSAYLALVVGTKIWVRLHNAKNVSLDGERWMRATLSAKAAATAANWQILS